MPLPDGRTYELVSPAQKSGGIGGVYPLGSLINSLEQFGRPLQSSSDGSAIAYLGEDFFHPRLGSLDQYISTRGFEGWSTQNVTLGVPSTGEVGVEANLDVGFSPDLATGVIKGYYNPLHGDTPAGFEPGLYADLYRTEGASSQPLVTGTPPNTTAVTFSLQFAGGNTGNTAVPAFSHALFTADDALTENAVFGGTNLYEWVGGKLRLVNILPDGKTEPGATFGADHGDLYNNEELPNLSNVISDDGSRIIWTDEHNGNIYVREYGEKTSLVGNGEFQTASVDGSRVFFTNAGSLYEYNATDAVTTNLASNGGVEGVIEASHDGTYVYFVAAGALAGNENTEREKAIEGQPNLYLSHEHEVSFIATLSPADNEVPSFYGSASPYGDWYRTFAGRTAEVSPNGRYLAFMSVKNLTGYDNADAVTSANEYEAFLFDSATSRLVCVSCNTNGHRPTSSTVLPAPVNGVYQQRYIDDGGRLFFSTEDAVLPDDTNAASDVYEYENGHVSLITPGSVRDEAVFADASESGDDVFFTTSQQLVPADQDQIVDLYDARVGGRTEGPPPISACSGEGCRGLPGAAPSFVEPVSDVFSGAGNLVPPTSRPANPTKKAAIKKTGKKHRKVRGKRSKKTGRRLNIRRVP